MLEPGCGGGRMLEALADRGFQVVGIDRSPRMVELSRERLGTRGEVFEADMTHSEPSMGPCVRSTRCSISVPQSSGDISTGCRCISSGVRATSSRSGWSGPISSRCRLASGSEPR